MMASPPFVLLYCREPMLPHILDRIIIMPVRSDPSRRVRARAKLSGG